MFEGIRSKITKMMAPVESNEATESIRKNVNSSMTSSSMDYSTVVEDLPLGYEAGRSGMKVWLPGYNGEEWLPALSGSLATQIYREMGDQDAYIAACLNAYRTFYRYARWHVEPVSEDPKDMEAAEFLEECMHDMRHGWSSFVSECSSTPQYGFSLFEIVYKKRDGKQEDYRKSSKFSDGRIGWGNFSPRAQNTILHFDWLPSDPNYLIGYTQLTPPDYPTNLFIPLEKSILIRTESVRESPWGRALVIDSMIHTLSGVKTMGTVDIGDTIFGGQGQKCSVVAKSEVFKDRPAYRVTFSGNNKINADENHLWNVTTSNDRINGKPERIMSTKELFEDFKRREEQGIKSATYSVGKMHNMEMDAKNLPIDPYILGYWLGDGGKVTATFAIHTPDQASFIKHAESVGYPYKVVDEYHVSVLNLRTQLRALGILDDKSIPAEYLHASQEQRLELLRGLMDSDGCPGDNKGRPNVWYNTNETLVHLVTDLVVSLGFKPSVQCYDQPGDLGGIIKGHRVVSRVYGYRVSFQANVPVFKLDRKASKQPLDITRTNEYIIQDVEYIGLRDTVCIEVDSPDHTFLAGNGIRTHNSILRSAYRSWFMKKYLEDIRCTIIERGGAGIPMAKIPVNLLNNTEYDEQGNVTSVDYAALQSLNSIKSMLKGLRMTKEPYVIIPQQFDENRNSLFDVGFLQSNGTDVLGHINTTIKELETAIMVSMMCEFLGVGNGGSGSMALAAVKSSNFTKAVTAHLHSIESSLNNQCVPRLFEMNPEFDVEDLPRIVHDSIEEIPAADIANVLSLFMRVGWDLAGQDNLRDAILTGMGLPKLVDKEEESPFGLNDGGEVTPEPEQFDDLDEVATPDMSMPNRGKNAKTPITTEPTVDTKLGKSACECEEVIKFDESKIKRDGDGQFSSTGSSSSSSSSYGGRKKPGINRAGKQKVDAQHPYKTVVSVPGYDDMHSNNAYSANEIENHVNGKMPEGQEFKIVDGETGDVVAHGVGGKGINWIKKAFDENKVKRDDGGKFSSTGGGSSSSPSSGDQASPSATDKPKFQRFATGNNVAPRSEEHKPASTSTPTASAPKATTAKPMENHTPKADAKSGAKVTQTVAIQPKVERHRNRARNYKNHLPRTCANPKCTENPNTVPHFEIHHIIPLSAKGEDKASNMVQVCPSCHRGGDLHSNWSAHVKELTEWKHAHDKSARKA